MEAEITLNISLHLQECNLDANVEKEDRRGKHFNCVLRYLQLMLCRTMSLYAFYFFVCRLGSTSACHRETSKIKTDRTLGLMISSQYHNLLILKIYIYIEH